MELVKKIRKNTIILIGITILVMVVVLKKDFPTIIKNFKTIDLRYLFLAGLCFLIYLVLHSYVVYKTVNKKQDFSWKESFKHNVIAQFFNGITPFSTGGQPMEIYMLTKHNIHASSATNYILQNFVFYQIALVLFGVVAVIMNTTFRFFPNNPILRKLVLLGFIVNILVAVALLFVSLSRKTIHRVVKLLIHLLNRLHLIKNQEKTTKKWEVRIYEFHECANELKKRKGLFVLGVILNFIGLACFYMIPLFIVYALHDFESLTAIQAMTASAYVMVMGSFVPILGASGGIEYGFTQFFGNFLNTGQTSTTLLLWRFITYYLGMILGAITFNLDKENRKEKEA